MRDNDSLAQQLKALAHEEAGALEGDLFWARLQTKVEVSSKGQAQAMVRPVSRLLSTLAMACALGVTLGVTLNLFQGASANWAVLVDGSAYTDLSDQPWATDSTVWMQALGEHLAGITLCAWLAGSVWWISRVSLWPKATWPSAR